MWDPRDDLDPDQREKLEAFGALLAAFNRKVNLVSRETIGQFEERHLVHALALAHRAFPPGSVVVDWGTGGGLPAIPLAIRFPDVTFHAVDAVEKKVHAVRTMARRLGLKNLTVWHERAEKWSEKAHYSVSRATAPLVDLWRWHRAARLPLNVDPGPGVWSPGLVCLKGGDLNEEIDVLRQAFPGVRVDLLALGPMLERSYFEGKYIVSVVD